MPARQKRYVELAVRRSALFAIIPILAVFITALLVGTPPAWAQSGRTPTCSNAYPIGLSKDKQVELRWKTQFLPGGREGELFLRYPISKIVTESDKSSKPIAVTAVRVLANGEEQNLHLFRAAPNKGEPGFTEGFLPADSLLLRFRVPAADAFPVWHKYDFTVFACGANDELLAWGAVAVPISNRHLVVVISIAAIVLLYILFVLAVWWARNRHNKLSLKYPEYDEIQPFSYVQYLFNPIHLTANTFNQASVQKLQTLVFSFLVAWMLLSYVLTRGNLTDLSETILMLLGISAVGTAIGQGANVSRERLEFENWSWLVRRKILPIHQTQTEGPRWGDLVLSRREFDIYKFQNLLFSIVVAVALVVAGEGRLVDFAIPASLLGILGLSQAIQVTGILVRPPSIGDLDKALTKLRELEKVIAEARLRNTDVDHKGQLIDPPVAGALVAANALRNYKEQADQVEVMLESALEAEVDRKNLDLL